MCKYLFITGGVASSLGKGVTVSSIGALLEARGYKVSLQKVDPYLNIDPGTMSPFEHGEVYVTEDGAETDLDLGNYERFTSVQVMRINSITTGQVYDAVLRKERKGEYLGKTVQIIPHITDEIKRRIRICAEQSKADIAIIEVGGTVGDIESVPFLEAIRQMAREEGKKNTAYVHLTLAPYLIAAEEVKSKPTQHSVRELRSAGIHPNVIVCRSQYKIDESVRKKISLFCDVDDDCVISAYNAKNSIYEMPSIYFDEGLDKVILEALDLDPKKANLDKWKKVENTIITASQVVKIAFVGKYVSHKDAYKSVYESLDHAGIANSVKLDIVRIDSEIFETDFETGLNQLKECHGLLIPGGFGERGIEGMLKAIQYARENDMPCFGICLGLQLMAIEFARNVLGLTTANSTEFKLDTTTPIISLMEEQKNLATMGGTMRLGSYEAKILKDSKAYLAYKSDLITERHRHRYEFNNAYIKDFEKAGMVFSGINAKYNLVEIMELAKNKWHLGGQFHPEFKSKPFAAHPLFRDFISVSKENSVSNAKAKG